MRPWSKRELLAYLDRVMPALEGLDHFELLDVPSNADSKTIQGAFHNMAAGLHPDRHRNILSPEQHERLIQVYARIAEAYRVLRSPEHRRAYLIDEAKKRGVDTPPPGARQDPAAALALLSPKAQQLYRRAVAAHRTGDRASAVLNMRMALAKHPQSGFLRDALKRLR